MNPSDKTFWDDSINQVTRHLSSYAVRLSKHLSCCLVKTVFSIYNTGKPLKVLTPILCTRNIETPSVTNPRNKKGKKSKLNLF